MFALLSATLGAFKAPVEVRDLGPGGHDLDLDGRLVQALEGERSLGVEVGQETADLEQAAEGGHADLGRLARAVGGHLVRGLEVVTGCAAILVRRGQALAGRGQLADDRHLQPASVRQDDIEVGHLVRIVEAGEALAQKEAVHGVVDLRGRLPFHEGVGVLDLPPGLAVSLGIAVVGAHEHAGQQKRGEQAKELGDLHLYPPWVGVLSKPFGQDTTLIKNQKKSRV